MQEGKSHLVFEEAHERSCVDQIRGMSFSHDSSRLAFCDYGSRVGVYDLTSVNNSINVNKKNAEEVQKDRPRFITGFNSEPETQEDAVSSREDANEWKDESNHVAKLRAYDLGCDSLFAISWRHDDSEILAAGSQKGSCMFVLADIKTYHQIVDPTTHQTCISKSNSMFAAKFSPLPRNTKNKSSTSQEEEGEGESGGDLFALAGTNQRIALFDAETRQHIANTPEVEDVDILGIDFNADATKVSCIYEGYSVAVFDISNPKEPTVFVHYKRSLSGFRSAHSYSDSDEEEYSDFWKLSFLKNSSSSNNNNILVWPASDGLKIANIEQDAAISSNKNSQEKKPSLQHSCRSSHWCSFLGSSNLFAMIGEKEFKVYNVVETSSSAEIQPLFSFPVDAGNCWASAVSPNGRFAAFEKNGHISVNLLELADYFWLGRKAAWKIRDLVPENAKCRLSQLFKSEYAPFFIVNKFLV